MALKKATPAKKPANATPAKKAPAQKVETPAQAQEPKDTPATGGAPAPDKTTAAAGSTGLTPDTTSQGQADLEGKSTAGTKPTDPETAAQGTAATDTANGGTEDDYRRGYSDGFSAALDELADGGGGDDGGNEPGPETGQVDYGQESASAPVYDRTSLIALALFTPENQRKGGIKAMVNRMQSFLDGLAPEDRWPALQFMHAIAQTKPMDIATGRFQIVIREGLSVLNGDMPLADEAAVTRGEMAAERFSKAFQQEDESEPAGGPEELDPTVDPEDPDNAAAAAARLAGA